MYVIEWDLFECVNEIHSYVFRDMFHSSTVPQLHAHINTFYIRNSYVVHLYVDLNGWMYLHILCTLYLQSSFIILIRSFHFHYKHCSRHISQEFFLIFDNFFTLFIYYLLLLFVRFFFFFFFFNISTQPNKSLYKSWSLSIYISLHSPQSYSSYNFVKCLTCCFSVVDYFHEWKECKI